MAYADAHVCILIRALSSRSVGLGFLSLVVYYQMDLKKWYSQRSCLVFSKKEIVCKTNCQDRLLCAWARQLTGYLYRYVAEASSPSIVVAQFH